MQIRLVFADSVTNREKFDVKNFSYLHLETKIYHTKYFYKQLIRKLKFLVSMALLKYLRNKDGLPDPRGSLSDVIPARTSSIANEAVREEIEASSSKKRRGPYKRYVPVYSLVVTGEIFEIYLRLIYIHSLLYLYRYDSKMRASIGKYASRYGVSAASRKFCHVVGYRISNSTIESLKKAYIKELHRKRQESITKLPQQKCGRPVLLGAEVDSQVQLYLQKVRQQGGVVSSRIAMAAARGILMSTDKQRLVEFGGYVNLNRHWAYSLLKRIKFVQRKVITAKSKYTVDNFKEVKMQSSCFNFPLYQMFSPGSVIIDLALPSLPHIKTNYLII